MKHEATDHHCDKCSYEYRLGEVSPSDHIKLASDSVVPTSDLRSIYQVWMHRSAPYRHNNQELTNHGRSLLYFVMKRTSLMSLLPSLMNLKGLEG